MKEYKPFAFSLKRRLLQSRSVLYLSKGLSAFISGPVDKDRITVHDELDNHTVHLRISNLQRLDTDVYYCEFHYSDLPFDKNIPGKMEFFIYVEDLTHQTCSCLGYLLLLYVISGAACVLGLLVVTLITAYYCKFSNRKNPQHLVPVYEEMTGVRPAKGTATSRHVENTTLDEEIDSTLLSKENIYAKSNSRKCSK
ncbi:cd7 antigen-like isoform X2 [Xyrauchen texanus]|nr:cd7 antigen-like isoform X2 [Xyrauchen texanus]